MNTADHDDDAQVENDPTGVRALLSSLPDPGPMPDAVFARINASLQDEQERREQQAAFGHDPSPDVISLAAERHRRRPMRTLTYLGAAASLAVAATVVSTQLFGPGDGGGTGISADVGASNEREADAAAPGPAATLGDADSGEAGSDEAAPGGLSEDAPEDDEAGSEGGMHAAQEDGAETDDGQRLMLAEGEVTLASHDFAQDVSRWHTTGPETAGPAGSELAPCAEALGSELPADAQLLLATGTLDGAPVVLVLQTDPAPMVAWALQDSCTDGTGDILQGPSVIP